MASWETGLLDLRRIMHRKEVGPARTRNLAARAVPHLFLSCITFEIRVPYACPKFEMSDHPGLVSSPRSRGPWSIPHSAFSQGTSPFEVSASGGFDIRNWVPLRSRTPVPSYAFRI